MEAQRLEQKTRFDLEMLKTVGYVSGIENYSRQLSFRKPGSPPATLLDYLPKDTIIFIDESHMSVPQIRGMYFGDQSRKQTLVDYGFRLPSALDNRPLKFEEFLKKVKEAIFVSATPAEFELSRSKGAIAEQLVRPTGLLDPWIEVRPAKEQIKDAEAEILKAVKAKERVLLLTLTKRLAEEVSDWLKERGIRAEYLHSEIKTLARTDILRKLREGEFDVLVGINLLREGLDLPEVALVLILDADKEGYLRNYTSLVQTIGRAARHTEGTVIMYADTTTGSMKKAVEETERRRKIQDEYNKKNGITPQPIKREIGENIFGEERKKIKFDLTKMSKQMSGEKLKQELEEEMLEAAKLLDFEKAAQYRDLLKTLL